MSAISLLIKPASGNCNMQCQYCFYCDEQEKRSQASYGMMQDETLRNLMRKMLKKADTACSIAFQGGEPTLAGLAFFRKVIAYEKIYNKNGVKVQYALQTNGAEMNEEWCNFLKENNFLVGLSVDGTKEIHDRYRKLKNGADTYQRIQRTAALFDAYQVDYNILTVVHREVAQSIEEIYEEYKQRGWKYQQYIACLDPLFEPPGGYEYSLTEKAYGDFLIELFNYWYRDLKKGKQPYIRQFENYIRILLGMQAEACDQRGCCSVQYVVEADGGVYPCDFYMLDEYLLGNINDTAVACLDQKRREIKFIEKSVQLSEKCRKCKFEQICRGGCMRQRTQNAEGLYENNYCVAYFRFFEKCFPKMMQIVQAYKNSSMG